MGRRDVILASAASGLLAGCGAVPVVVRYQLSLHLLTPDGPRTGDGVIEVEARKNSGILAGLGSGSDASLGVRGDAIVTDLGARGVLACMLNNDEFRRGSYDAETLLRPAFERAAGGAAYEPWVDLFRRIAQERGTATLKLVSLPLLVHFASAADPLSARSVDPNDLASSIGPGFLLKDASLAITDRPVTRTVTGVLPWAQGMKGTIASSHGLSRPYRDVLSRITDASFRQGFKK
jgi:hypothetical protein